MNPNMLNNTHVFEFHGYSIESDGIVVNKSHQLTLQ